MFLDSRTVISERKGLYLFYCAGVSGQFLTDTSDIY